MRSLSHFMFWSHYHRHHIFGKVFYYSACAASSTGSFHGRARTVKFKCIYNLPLSKWLMNIKTVKIGNILAWNTGEHYFADTHNPKHFHREEKQFQRQRGMCKKTLYVTSNNILIYAILIRIKSLNIITFCYHRITSLKYFELMKFPQLWKNYICSFLFASNSLLAGTQKNPLQNHIRHISLINRVGPYSSIFSLLRVRTIACLQHFEFH